MTTQWEASLDAISSQTLSYKAFMEPLNTTLGEMINQAKVLDTSLLKNIKQKPKASFKRKTKRRGSKAKKAVR